MKPMKNRASLLLLGHKFHQVGKLLAPTRGPLHVPMGLGLALPLPSPRLSHGVWCSSLKSILSVEGLMRHLLLSTGT